MKNIMGLVVAVLALGGCKKDAARDGAAAIAKIEELRDEACKCKDAACAKAVSEKMTAWTREQTQGGKSPPKMSETDAKQVAAIGNEMGRCIQTAMATEVAPPPTGSDTSAPPDMTGAAPAGSAAPSADGLPAECAAYKAQVEKLETCEKMSPKVKEALLKSFNDAATGWAKMPEGAKAGLDTSCKAATEALVVAAKEACGW
jgi:hypothetical protein